MRRPSSSWTISCQLVPPSVRKALQIQQDWSVPSSASKLPVKNRADPSGRCTAAEIVFQDRRFKKMKSKLIQPTPIRVAVVCNDPLRAVGFRALLEPITDLELTSASIEEARTLQGIDVALLSNHDPRNGVQESLAGLKAACPDLRVIVTGWGMDDEAVYNAVAVGARGYIDESASAATFVKAIRTVQQGAMWVSRHVFSMFIERLGGPGQRTVYRCVADLTPREKQVLEMLVQGRSNREIGEPLGIRLRTVKAHIAKLLRKIGVPNRIALTVHALSHELVSSV
jgi:DNA-binding NarL/FixJ family response regulator